MNQQKFKNLKVGDKVTLNCDLLNYYRDKGVFNGRPEYIKAGSTGIIGAVNCPAVTGRDRDFICIDFPDFCTEYKNDSGELCKIIPRVGAFRGEIR